MKKVPLSIYSFIILLLVIVTGSDFVSKALQQSDIELLAQNLELSYELVSVKNNADCLADKSLGTCYLFQLSMTMPMAFNKQGWEIYFSQKSPILKGESENIFVRRISDELHHLYPKEKFSGFEQNKAVHILLTIKALEVEEDLSQLNFYIMSDGLKATVIKSSLSK